MVVLRPDLGIVAILLCLAAWVEYFFDWRGPGVWRFLYNRNFGGIRTVRNAMQICSSKTTLSRMYLLLAAGAIMMSSSVVAQTADTSFGPSNPFYAPSTLPFQAPPFDKIKDSDYQPAIEAGMAEQLKEVRAIADNPAAPTFENTVVAMEKTGDLLTRVSNAFSGVTGANTNPVLEKLQEIEAPKLAAHS